MKYSLLTLMVVFVACTGNTTSIEGFDSTAWKKDKNGCDHIRDTMVELLSESVESMKGLSENEILEVLGSPDLNELYKRNQKFYIYHITPSLECGSTGQDKQLFLEIRFSATNLAREVMIKESGG